MTMSRTKEAYMIGCGLGPYSLQKTIDDILRSPNTYSTIHIDETTTAKVKKQMDVLVRYLSDTDGKVKVRFLKALVFGHAFAETVADELWRSFQELQSSYQVHFKSTCAFCAFFMVMLFFLPKVLFCVLFFGQDMFFSQLSLSTLL